MTLFITHYRQAEAQIARAWPLQLRPSHEESQRYLFARRKPRELHAVPSLFLLSGVVESIPVRGRRGRHSQRPFLRGSQASRPPDWFWVCRPIIFLL